MRRILLIFSLLLVAVVWAQQPPPVSNETELGALGRRGQQSYTLTEPQSWKLRALQGTLLVSNDNLAKAQNQFNRAVVELRAACDEVRKENRWEDGVYCDLNTIPPDNSTPLSFRKPAPLPKVESKK